MFVGEYVTRHFDFLATGRSESEVKAMMLLAWHQHKIDYKAPDLEPINTDDIRIFEIPEVGACRDGEVIVDRSK